MKIPLCNEGSVNELSRWLNTLVGIDDKNLASLTCMELKLIILSARGREQAILDQNKKRIDHVNSNLRSLMNNVDEISKKFQENTKLIESNTHTFKSYAEVASVAANAIMACIPRLE